MTNKKKQTAIVNGMDDSPRGKLLSEAARLFQNKGYERTTVRDIASAVGIQSGSIFHHFKSKEDILCAVMEEVIQFNTKRLRDLVDNVQTTKDKVLVLIECELQSILGETGEAMSVLVYEWRALNDEKQAYILAMREIYEQIWLEVLKKARSEGLISIDPVILRRLLTGTIAWTSHWYQRGGPLTLEELAKSVLQMAITT